MSTAVVYTSRDLYIGVCCALFCLGSVVVFHHEPVYFLTTPIHNRLCNECACLGMYYIWLHQRIWQIICPSALVIIISHVFYLDWSSLNGDTHCTENRKSYELCRHCRHKHGCIFQRSEKCLHSDITTSTQTDLTARHNGVTKGLVEGHGLTTSCCVMWRIQLINTRQVPEYQPAGDVRRWDHCEQMYRNGCTINV